MNRYGRAAALRQAEQRRRQVARTRAGASISRDPVALPATPQPSDENREGKISFGAMLALAAIGIGASIYVFSPSEIPDLGGRPPVDRDDEEDEQRQDDRIARRRIRNAEKAEEDRREMQRIEENLGPPQSYDASEFQEHRGLSPSLRREYEEARSPWDGAIERSPQGLSPHRSSQRDRQRWGR